MRRKQMRVVMLAGVLFAVVVALLLRRQSLWPLPLTHLASGIRAMLEAGYLRVRPAVAGLAPGQLVGVAAVAWFFFALALFVLARSAREERLADDVPVRVSPADDVDGAHVSEAMVVDSAPANGLTVRRSTAYSQAPLISPLPAHSPEQPMLPEVPGAAADPVAPDVEAASQYVAGPTFGPSLAQLPADDHRGGALETHLATLPSPMSSPDTRGKSGHLLALTGVAPAEGRTLPYGLFLIAEDVRAASSYGDASRQIVEVIAAQVAPLLANDTALHSEHHAELLKMAILRASLAVRSQGIRTCADRGAVVAGMMIVGRDVYVVNVGHCRTYLFRPSAGLIQIGTDHSVVSCLVATGLVPQEAVYQHPRRDHAYRSVGGEQPVIDIDTFALRVQRGDQMVLCSPSLWQRLRTADIEAIVRSENDPRCTAERLSRAASRGDADAASVIVVRPREEWTPGFGIQAA